jgi:hypothetical protein
VPKRNDRLYCMEAHLTSPFRSVSLPHGQGCIFCLAPFTSPRLPDCQHEWLGFAWLSVVSRRLTPLLRRVTRITHGMRKPCDRTSFLNSLLFCKVERMIGRRADNDLPPNARAHSFTRNRTHGSDFLPFSPHIGSPSHGSPKLHVCFLAAGTDCTWSLDGYDFS